MEIIDSKVEQYAYDHTKPASKMVREIEGETKKELQYSQMLSGRIEGHFLQMLVKLMGAKKILEIGMFTGYSALSMAEALPDDGQIITCDTNDRYRKIAQHFFESSPDGGKIKILMGPALETLENVTGPFDMIFLDADKDNYPAYYEMVFPMLRIGGLLVVDNVLWSGKILDPVDRKTQSIDSLNKTIVADNRVENVLLTVRDGINLVRKVSN